MKRNIIFIPASIKSHILPSFFIAKHLREKYNIFYLLAGNNNKDLVEQNGYNSIHTEGFKILYGMERSFLLFKKKSNGFFSHLKSIASQDILEFRKDELGTICGKLNPVAIYIDIFASTDYVVLKGLGICKNLFFFNPMPSTYRIQNYPSVSESEFLQHSYKAKPTGIRRPKFSISNFLSSPCEYIISILQYHFSKKAIKDNNISFDVIADNNDYTIGFNNVPELLLLPSEFEFSPEIRLPWQYYLGLCVDEERNQTELDEEFDKEWDDIISSQKKVIYCSFGTFYSGSTTYLVSFIEKLLTIGFEFEECIFVIATPKAVKEQLKGKKKNTENFYFFSHVPQLMVLKHANLYICHGGMGSIKESIMYETPLLVLPLDNNYDQRGNALKVEFHKIGLRGDFFFDSPDVIKTKMREILQNPVYEAEVTSMKNQIVQKYSKDSIFRLINDFIV